MKTADLVDAHGEELHFCIGFEYIPSAATSASTAFLPGWKRLLSEKVSP